MGVFRLLLGSFIVAVALASTAILAELRPNEEAGINRIAFVDIQGTVRTMNHDGSDIRRISTESDDGFFTWPTWSPDGKTLVYSGVTGNGDDVSMNLYASNSGGSRNREIFAGENGVIGLLAEGVVHYPLWSPNSEQIAFIATTEGGLTLFLDDLSGDPHAKHILDRGPLWISWSSDSKYLAAHRSSEHFIIEAADEPIVRQTNIISAGYRVPAWQPGMNSLTVARQLSGTTFEIATSEFTDSTLREADLIGSVQANPAFLWSPNGNNLAVAHTSQLFSYQGLNMDIYLRLSVLTQDGSERVMRITEPILGYFWSPDSTKLAYVTLSETRGVLRWKIADLQQGNQFPLVDFIPSLEQLTVFQFFDQYAYSHMQWSPDSDALVFSGNLNTDSVTASSEFHPGHQGFHVIVVNTDVIASPQILAEGFLAFWSPR